MDPRLNEGAPELINRIVDFLPLESVAALALTCRYLCHLLKKKYLDPLWHSRPSRRRYPCRSYRRFHRANYPLALLFGRDLPDHIACFHCKCFHYISIETASQYRQISRPYFSQVHTACSFNYGFWEKTGSCISYFFAPTVFFMGMKRHRQGQDTSALLSLLSSKELRLFSRSIVEWNHLSVRIHKNRFLVRYQTISTPAPVKPIASKDFWHRRACPHMELTADTDGRGFHICRAGKRSQTTVRRFTPFNKEESEWLSRRESP